MESTGKPAIERKKKKKMSEEEREEDKKRWNGNILKKKTQGIKIDMWEAEQWIIYRHTQGKVIRV